MDDEIVQELQFKLQSIIQNAFSSGLINKDAQDFLFVLLPVLPVFDALPKLQKGIVQPPGRPIISRVGNASEKASIFLDEYLRPHITGLPSYSRDMVQLLQIVEDMTVPTSSVLVTIDIEALYSSIPHELGINAGARFLAKRDVSQYPRNVFFWIS